MDSSTVGTVFLLYRCYTPPVFSQVDHRLSWPLRPRARVSWVGCVSRLLCLATFCRAYPPGVMASGFIAAPSHFRERASSEFDSYDGGSRLGLFPLFFSLVLGC